MAHPDVVHANSEVGVNYTGDGCILGTTADLFVATWRTLDTYTHLFEAARQRSGT